MAKVQEEQKKTIQLEIDPEFMKKDIYIADSTPIDKMNAHNFSLVKDSASYEDQMTVYMGEKKMTIREALAECRRRDEEFGLLDYNRAYQLMVEVILENLDLRYNQHKLIYTGLETVTDIQRQQLEKYKNQAEEFREIKREWLQKHIYSKLDEIRRGVTQPMMQYQRPMTSNQLPLTKEQFEQNIQERYKKGIEEKKQMATLKYRLTQLYPEQWQIDIINKIFISKDDLEGNEPSPTSQYTSEDNEKNPYLM